MKFFTATTPLLASATWLSSTTGNVPGFVTTTGGADTVRGIVFSDQSGTLSVDFSGDGINWDFSVSHALTGGTGIGFNDPAYAQYVRLRYVNGGVNQVTFRLFARLHSNDQSNG